MKVCVIGISEKERDKSFFFQLIKKLLSIFEDYNSLFSSFRQRVTRRNIYIYIYIYIYKVVWVSIPASSVVRV